MTGNEIDIYFVTSSLSITSGPTPFISPFFILAHSPSGTKMKGVSPVALSPLPGLIFVSSHFSVPAAGAADAKAVATGLVRGAFEYQGQKCSAASRAYIPSNLWEEIKSILILLLSCQGKQRHV